MNTRPFRHSPLNNKIKEIRLLTIVARPDGPIQCCLKHFDLSSYPTPDYRALSYTWGPELPSQEIIVNGCSLIVRQNLYDFLESARQRLVLFGGNGQYEQEIQWLWVDQICVDQSLTVERNHQVQMMAEIFQRASYVYIWLGPADELTEAVMATIKLHHRRHLERKTEIARRRIRKTKNQAIEGKPYELCTEEMGSREVGDTSPQVTAAGMQRFFGNPYWTRLWIIQEILLARYLRVICGNTYISWEELKRFCCNDAAQDSVTSFNHDYPKIAWLAEHAMSAVSFQLLPLIRMFSTSVCQEPRDKVYGLQGLVEKSCRVEIDYGLSIKSVFWRAALAICEEMDETRAKWHSKADRNWLRTDSQDWESASDAFSKTVEMLRADVRYALGLDVIDTLILLHQDMGIPPPTLLIATKCQLVDRVAALCHLLEDYHINNWRCWYEYRGDYFKHIDQDFSHSEIVAQLIFTCHYLLKSLREVLGYFATCDIPDFVGQEDEENETEDEANETDDEENETEDEENETEEGGQAEERQAIDNEEDTLNISRPLYNEQRISRSSYRTHPRTRACEKRRHHKERLLDVWDHKISIRVGDVLPLDGEVSCAQWQADITTHVRGYTRWTTLKFRDDNKEFKHVSAKHSALDNVFRYMWKDIATVEQRREDFQSNRFNSDDFPNQSLAVISLLETL